MAKRQSTFRRGLRVVQLGMAFGLLSLLCQLLVAKPLNLLLATPAPGAGIAALELLLANFPLLVATPLLISASALAIEIPPWKVAIIAQLFVLVILWTVASLSMGMDVFLQSLPTWIPQLMAAIIGVLLSGFGYDKVASLRQRSSPSVSASAPADTPVRDPSPTATESVPAGPPAGETIEKPKES